MVLLAFLREPRGGRAVERVSSRWDYRETEAGASRGNRQEGRSGERTWYSSMSLCVRRAASAVSWASHSLRASATRAWRAASWSRHSTAAAAARSCSRRSVASAAAICWVRRCSSSWRWRASASAISCAPGGRACERGGEEWKSGGAAREGGVQPAPPQLPLCGVGTLSAASLVAVAVRPSLPRLGRADKESDPM